MKSFSYGAPRTWMGRLERGDDILDRLTAFCRERGVTSGSIQAIGAVERGGVGYYDQQAGGYREIRFDQGMEIAALSGNVSRKEGDVFCHCHVILADREGRCFGGHLLEGNLAFACEFVVSALEGEPPLRTPDKPTGLMLW